MPNQRQDTTGTNQPKRPPSNSSADADVSKQQQRGGQQDQRKDEDRDDPERVEIGDPVPEDDRTTRARGETGEDEDLPGDARGGETGEDEDLPDDDSGAGRSGGRTVDPH